MRHVLAVLLDERGADVLETAVLQYIHSVGDHCHVVLLQLYDRRYVERLCGKLREDGWLSGRQSEELGKKLQASYLQRLETASQEITQRFRANGIDVTHLELEGEIVNTVLKTQETHAPIDRIVIARPRPHLFRRIFGGLSSKVLSDRASCPVDEVEWS
jgi:nucleotide-binding universal stress UspA family protein